MIVTVTLGYQTALGNCFKEWLLVFQANGFLKCKYYILSSSFQGKMYFLNVLMC